MMLRWIDDWWPLCVILALVAVPLACIPLAIKQTDDFKAVCHERGGVAWCPRGECVCLAKGAVR